MAFRPIKFTQNTVKNFFNVKAWIDINTLKEDTVGLKQAITPLFQKEKTHENESFDQAMARFDLNNDDLVKKLNGLTKQIYVYLVTMLLAIVYLVFLLTSGRIFSFFIALVVTLLLCYKLITAHYYRYQIQHRKLGTSLSEWWLSIVNRKKS